MRSVIAGTASGVLLAAASLPGPQGPLVLVALAPLLRFLAGAPSHGEAALAGTVCGAFGVLAGFGWAIDVEGATGSVGATGLSLVGSGLIALSALFAVAIARLARHSAGLALACAPPLWVMIEYFRAQDWGLPLPWNQLGYALGESPALMQAASVTGAYGLSLWAVATAAGIAASHRVPWRARLLGGIALALPAFSGWTLLQLPGPSSGPGLRVAAVQPLSRVDPSGDSSLQNNLRLILELSEEVAPGADVVVWPESAWHRVVTPVGDPFLGSIAHHLGTPVLTGVSRFVDSDSALRNRVVLAGSARTQRAVAAKVHPVPFFERAPLGLLGRTLARHGSWPGRFSPGTLEDPILIEGAQGTDVLVGSIVCIDTAYPDIARTLRRRGARILLSLTNEALTGSWSARQHARIARIRAVENRTPVVRVANTGPTLWIDSRGRVVAELPAGRAASGVEFLTLAGPPPLAVHLGDAPVLAGSAAVLLAIPWLVRFPRRAPSTPKENP